MRKTYSINHAKATKSTTLTPESQKVFAQIALLKISSELFVSHCSSRCSIYLHASMSQIFILEPYFRAFHAQSLYQKKTSFHFGVSPVSPILIHASLLPLRTTAHLLRFPNVTRLPPITFQKRSITSQM